MSFRRKENSHDIWLSMVRESSDLLTELPAGALASEEAFRGYMTNGTYREVRFSPQVSELSRKALDDLWTFINHKTELDMDAILFDDFNDAFRAKNG